MNDSTKQHSGHIFGSILFLSNAIENAGNKLFKEITMKQWFILAAMHHSGINSPTLSQISGIMGYSRQNVKKLALHLEGKGFVTLDKNPNDKRVLLISTTPKCNEYLSARESTESAFLEKLFKGLTPTEIATVSAAMEILEKNVKTL